MSDIQRVIAYAEAEKVSAFYFSFPSRENLLIPRSALFVLKHPWWYLQETERITATVGVETHQRTWRLIGLLVLPDKRKAGYGSLCVNHVLGLAKEADVEVKIATLIPDFFTRFGFQIYDVPFKSGIVKMRYG